MFKTVQRDWLLGVQGISKAEDFVATVGLLPTLRAGPYGEADK